MKGPTSTLPFVLLLCSINGVKSDDTAISVASSNATTSLLSSTSTFSDTSTITSAPNSSPSGLPPQTSFTGVPNSLVGWCFSLYQSFLDASGTPSVVTSTNTGGFTFPYSSGTDLSLISTVSYTTTFSFTTTLVPTPYKPPLDCYVGCQIHADHVRLEYWPTPTLNGTTLAPTATITPAPIVTAVVDGKTLYSPSNYLVFTEISAVDCFWDNSPCSTIGVAHDVTLAYGQNELMSENCFHAFDTFNYADFNTPVPWSIVSTQIGCTLITESHPGNEPNYDFTLMPNILYPQNVRTAISSDWASCTFIDAAYDPPSALTPVKQLTTPASPGNPPTDTVTLTPTVPPAQSENLPSSSGPVQTPNPSTRSAPDPPASTAIESPPFESTPSPTQPAPPAQTPDPPIQTPDSPIQTPDPPVDTPNPPSQIPDPPQQTPIPPETTPNPPAQIPQPPASSSEPLADPNLPTAPQSTSPPSIQPVNQPVIQQVNQPENTDVGSIIASVGGLIPPPVIPDSTITFPGQITSLGDIPSAVTTIGGRIISLSPGSVTVIPGIDTSIEGVETSLQDITISAPSPTSVSSMVATIGENTITIAPDGGSAVVEDQTVIAGSSPITVSSIMISLGPSGIVMNSTTIAFATSTSNTGSVVGTLHSGYNVSTAVASGPIQASSAHYMEFSKGCTCIGVLAVILALKIGI